MQQDRLTSVRGDTPNILIAEDEDLLALDLERTLGELGYRVAEVAASGARAIDLTGETKPDLVLMDIALKGSIDGIEAAHKIRERYRVPVIFLTANTNSQTVSRANEAAPYGYLVKPWRPKELDATIRVALHQHRLLEEMFAGQAWLTTLMASISDGIIATDADAVVRFLNPAGAQLLGFSASESLGEPIEHILRLSTLSGQAIEFCQLRKAVAMKAVMPEERFQLRTKSGIVTPIEDAAAPIVQGGRVVGAVSVFRDITTVLSKEREQQARTDRLEEEVQVTTEALGETRAELRALSAHLMQAQEQERQRLARDLHDDFGQRTALLDMYLDRLSALLPVKGQTAPLIEKIRTQMTELSQGLREMSHNLHPAVLSDLGLVPGLQNLVSDFQRGGMQIRLEVKGFSDQLPMDVSTAFYRIAQEALRNAARHAPDSHVHLVLSEKSQNVQLSIEDSGPGFDLKGRAKSGMGLLSMQERARIAGGNLLLRTAPGRGTRILVRVPVALLNKQNL